jgi:hypothetical protein
MTQAVALTLTKMTTLVKVEIKVVVFRALIAVFVAAAFTVILVILIFIVVIIVGFIIIIIIIVVIRH